MEKRIFTIKEMAAMGYSETGLRHACRIAGQTFAHQNVSKPGSKWYINLEAYEAFLRHQTAEAQRDIRYTTTIHKC